MSSPAFAAAAAPHPIASVAAADPDPAVLAARAVTDEVLARVVRLLDDVADAHARSAQEVRGSWRGPHRSRFDAERARRDGELAGLAAACRRLAGR